MFEIVLIDFLVPSPMKVNLWTLEQLEISSENILHSYLVCFAPSSLHMRREGGFEGVTGGLRVSL